ncbi:AAA family ATPase, partial [Steroidobacter sp.]|uniref:AAA family ATPase n=1 Tax=Steroidobacter sp. TaxID=1978227 RepID=UPI001A531B33
MSRAAAQPTRGVASAIRPLDQDTKLHLVREEFSPAIDVEPVWDEGIQKTLSAFVEERAHISSLERAGITPTSTLLFTGPPGVGKTLAARWLAQQTQRPLLTLDLAAVM